MMLMEVIMNDFVKDTKSPSFSCAPRPYARRSEQVWSDVQARSGAETPGTPNASGTIFSYKRMCAQKNRQVWSFVVLCT